MSVIAHHDTAKEHVAGVKSPQHAVEPARLPILSLFIGALLLLISGALFILYLLSPKSLLELEPLQGFSPLTLLLTLLAGGYLLACLIPQPTLRTLLQRLAAGLLITATLLLLLLTPRTPFGISLPSSDALLAFLLAGGAALLNPSVRSLSHVAACFLLILLAAALAILGLTILALGYDPFLYWSGGRSMNSHTAISLLLFSAGLAYTIWWNQRRKEFDPVAGTTLLAATLLFFSLFIGAVLIYAVATAHLHFEVRDDMSRLLKERAARITDTLHHAQLTASILSYEAEQKEGNLWSQHLVDDYALRITDKHGRLIRQHNGSWLAQKTLFSLDSGNSTLWRGEHGHCQLRTTLQRADVDIVISVPVNLMAIMTPNHDDNEDGKVLLCGKETDSDLRCLSAQGKLISPPAAIADYKNSAGGNEVQIQLLHDNIEATLLLPDYGLIAHMEKSHQQIFGPLYNKLLLTLPLALLLLIASIVLLAWRIQPIARRLQQNEQRYRSLVDGAADAIFLHDSERHFIEANPAAVTLLGYAHQDLLGMHPNDFLLPEDHASARDQLERLKRDGTQINIRRLLRRKDGSLIPVEVRATRLDTGQIISVVRDISEQQLYEESLRERERYIRSVLEVLAEGVLVHNADGEVIFTNQSAQRMLGRANSSQPPYRTFIQEDGSPFPASLHPAIISLRQGLSKRGVIMGVVHGGGTCTWISVNSDPLWDEVRNRIIGSVASFSDITDQRATEQALHQSREQLRALSSHLLQVREEEKMAIAREIHDELGANLSAIKMGVEWLNGQIQTPTSEVHDRLAHLLRITAHTIKSARNLVTQLRPTIVEDLGLWSALEWLLREFEQNTGIETSYRLQTHHLELPQQTALILYRVVQEALTNIAKHAHAHKVHLECWHNDGILHLALEDDGVGLSEETTFNINAYGIRGMYERIEQLHGTLQFLGSPGEGTLIAITIPYSSPEEESGIHD